MRLPRPCTTGALLLAFALSAPAEAKEQRKVAASAKVIINAFQYVPEHVTIRRGGTVTFVNQDGVPHTVTPEAGAHFKGTGLIEGGSRAIVRFDSRGRQPYHCDFHPSMTGVVMVE